MPTVPGRPRRSRPIACLPSTDEPPPSGADRHPRAIIDLTWEPSGGPHRATHRLLLRRARGDRQGQGAPRPRASRRIPSARSSTTRASSRPPGARASRPSRRSTTSTTARPSSSAPTASGRTSWSAPRSAASRSSTAPAPGSSRSSASSPKLVEEGYTIVLLGHAEAPRGRRPARLRAGRDRRRRGRGLGAAIPRTQADGAHQPVHPAALEVREARRVHGQPRATSSRSSTRSARSRSAASRTRSSWPREVDLMVVVGGRSSANTKELTRLCEIAGTPAIQIESVARPDRCRRSFAGARVVGVTGGTSHPDRGPARRRRADPRACRHAETPGTRAPSCADGRARAGRHAGRPDHARCPTRRRRRRPTSRCRRAPEPPWPASGLGGPAGRRHRRPAQRRQEHALQPDRRRARRRSSRTARGRRATASTATPSGTAAGSSSSTPAASSSTRTTRSRRASRSRRGSPSPRRTSSSSSSTPRPA